jgi:signal peptidase I
MVEIAETVLGKGLRFRFQARGWSMAPLIRDRDVLTLGPLPETEPHFGDVVAFRRLGSEKLMVHRIVGKKNNLFVLHGDANPEADSPIPVSHILGRVAQVERNGRQVRLGLGLEKYLIAILVRTGCLNFILDSLRTLVGIRTKSTTS